MSITIHEDNFGYLKENGDIKKEIRRFTLANKCMKIQVINYGATITSLSVPDKDGNLDDIVLGFDDLTSYINHTHYFGCTVGRFANRISRGRFLLQGKQYNLAVNNGPNHLHGGIKGFDKVVWDYVNEDNKVTFSYKSPAMDENYPGELQCYVTYELTDQNDVIIRYKATATEMTPINLTNHSYFNLSGHGSGTIHDHIISINADNYTPVDETSIPTGEICPVESTHFNLRHPKKVASILREIPGGVDHNFCVNGDAGVERKVASVYHPESGRMMQVFSTQPGVQLYTANFLPDNNLLLGKNGKYYAKHGALCLETQNYPDAINHPNFPKAFIDVGEIYSQTTQLIFPNVSAN